MTKGVFKIALVIAVVSGLAACSKNDDAPTIQPYTVPTTYDFQNADYAEATVAVNMWSGFTGYLGKGSTRQLSQDTVNNLWNNTGNSFTTEFVTNLPNTAQQLNSAGFNLASKTAEPLVIKAFADSMVKVSQYYNTPGTEGIPGKQGSRLVNYAGYEFNQGVAKGLMGAMQLAKVIQHLEASTKADNNAVVAGKGTAMQHEWDMAFGYVGIPKTYDTAKAYANTDTERPLAVGGYFAERGKYIKAGGTTFEAFRKGRAAIGAKDYAVRDAAMVTIKQTIEKTMAAACYYYITHPQAITDRPSQLHELSEGRSFITALKFRASNSLLSPANYQTLVDIIGVNQSAYGLINDASFTKLKQAQQILTTTYGQLQP
ncbi:MAG: DUF4856 domain-containing protein [Chitinophagaceae bacterium]